MPRDTRATVVAELHAANLHAPRNAGNVGIACAEPSLAGSVGMSRTEPSPIARPDVGGRSGWRVLRRVALYALTAAVVIVAAPLATLQLNRVALYDFNVTGAIERVGEVEQVRWLRVAPNPAVSPAEAGAALQALLPVRNTDDFPVRPAAPISWPSAQFTPGLFADVRTPRWWGPDASRLITRVAERVTAEELAFLETMATLPVWTVLDRAAHAPRADVLGGRFQLPLAADANVIGMPVPRFGDVRTLAYASVMRAAYHVARQDYTSAEDALRNTASVGLLLVDDAPFIIDGLMGRVMIGIAADGLSQLYTLTGNTAGLAALRGLREQTPRTTAANAKASKPSTPANLDDTRRRLLQAITNPVLPRSVRWEQLMRLQWSTCAVPLEALTGSSPVVEAAFAEARRSLVRTEAERQYLERLRQLTGSAAWHGDRTTPHTLVSAASAQVVSAVTGRPQLATCTRMLAGMR